MTLTPIVIRIDEDDDNDGNYRSRDLIDILHRPLNLALVTVIWMVFALLFVGPVQNYLKNREGSGCGLFHRILDCLSTATCELLAARVYPWRFEQLWNAQHDQERSPRKVNGAKAEKPVLSGKAVQSPENDHTVEKPFKSSSDLSIITRRPPYLSQAQLSQLALPARRHKTVLSRFFDREAPISKTGRTGPFVQSRYQRERPNSALRRDLMHEMQELQTKLVTTIKEVQRQRKLQPEWACVDDDGLDPLPDETEKEYVARISMRLWQRW